ncbi:MAG: hypothetical protein QM708_16120 [Propioniciclava sp.]|uniref:hypothetical protein n=1 Tax=Propioniciclava sp. TaxID=2038686 RepID=UPI0039E6CA0F
MAERGRRLSANARRAQELLKAGLAGGHAVAFTVIGLFWVVSGPQAGATAAIGAAATLAFYTIALGVQLAVADASPKVVLFAWFASYVTRVSLLGLALAAVLANAERWAWLDPVALFTGTVGTVGGWLGAELWTFSRMRVPVYDPPDISA